MSTQFRILGPIAVETGDRGGRVPRGRTLSLLALLLVNRGSIVHVDRAVDELWGGADPQHGRKAVQVLASRLRAALDEGVLVTEGGGYALRPPAGSLDADRFEALLQRGRAELASGEPDEAAATLRQALALWRGPALADVAGERFAQPEATRLETLRLACLADRIDADLACGRHEELVGELEALVQQHPHDERLRGRQMLALYHAGRQADALDAYRAAYEALTDGLGIEPSAELRSLEAAILRHEIPAPAAPQEPPLPPDVRRRVTCVVVRPALAGADPESLRARLERDRELASAACARHGGSVAEVRGEELLLAFGTPRAHEDDALRALRASLELRGDALALGVGTGDVVAPLIGEAPAAAERQARAAAPGEIRIDEPTWRLVRHGARTSKLPGGAFLLTDLDADAPAILRRLDRPLVGRDEELARLRATFARVVGERAPALLTIRGEPGIGKSRLAAELPALVGPEGRVLTGRCPSYGEGVTYWPLREMVDQARGERTVDALAAALGVEPAVGHQVAAAVGLAPGRAGDDPGWAFTRLIAALARAQPLVMVVDDAHLAEPALLELLVAVAGRIEDAPVLIVWVARPDSGSEAGDVLELGPLSDAASAALLEGSRLERDERVHVARAAGGNPLFLEQLVAYLEDHGPAGLLPPALHALLAARLDRLGDGERSALAYGAIVGDAFELEPVHALADDMTRAALEQAWERLVDLDLLEPGDGGAVRFRHGLVREAAYASLTKSVRARLHERHAAWLDDLGGELPEADARIAFHLESACRYQRGLTGAAAPALLRRAGDRLAAAARVARGRGDLLGEIGFLDRAVALLGTESEQGAALLPVLLWALCDAGASERGRGGRGAGGGGDRRAGPRRRGRAVGDRARADPALPPPGALRRARGGRDRGARVGQAPARGRRARAGAGRVPDVRRHVADGRHRPLLRRGGAHARPRAAGRQRVRRRDGADLHGVGPGRGAVAGARGDRPLRRARGRRGRAARRRPQPARLPGGSDGDDRPLRRGARVDGGGPRRARRAAAGRDRRLPRAARRDRRDAGRGPRRGGARGPRRRGDGLRVGDPLVPGLHLRRPRPRDPRAGPRGRGGRGGRADRDAAGALRRRVGDQAPHRAGAAGGPGGRPRARARGRPRGASRPAMPPAS